MQPSIVFAGQLLFLVPLPRFLPIFLRKHSHFRSTPCLPYRSQLLLAAALRFRVPLSLVQS